MNEDKVLINALEMMEQAIRLLRKIREDGYAVSGLTIGHIDDLLGRYINHGYPFK